ncbi:MAG: biotin--[Clostridia bacterium]|nr:biotin--[acetyl-CoA-carboxylase] ligase [Clostridia bacterium]
MKTVKERTRDALLAAKGRFLSGGELARQIGVSRSAVWKAVKALSADGYEIRSVTGRGYCLTAGDVLSPEGIARLLQTAGWMIETYDTVDSTNRVVKDLAERGAPEGAVVVAKQQTAGRGRRGRSFVSPPDTGLYMSLLLRPDAAAEDALFITTAAAVAVCRAIERVSGEAAQIKWVNDVFCRGKKVCGILTEASLSAESGRLDYAVLGIGVNLHEPPGGFPPAVAAVAGSVLPAGESGDRCVLAAAILDEFSPLYAALSERTFLEEYRARSLLRGRAVTVCLPSGDRAATAIGVDERCRLLVRFDGGEEQTLSSGDVSIKL